MKDEFILAANLQQIPETTKYLAFFFAKKTRKGLRNSAITLENDEGEPSAVRPRGV
jgi:hypothetical protein